MSSAAESFLYIWYDTKNKKYYLGKHKGTPDDSYTHSSTIMESFNKDNIPSYMKRRILAYGTDEEMCLLEHECLKNRKEKKWDRYYNVHVGSPWLDQWGENNPNYKHGLSGVPEHTKKVKRQHYLKNKEEILRKHKEWYKQNQEYVKEYRKKYFVENRDALLQKDKEYYEKNKEEILRKQREYGKRNREAISKQKKEYYEKNKEKIKQQMREYHWKNRDSINERKRKKNAKKYDGATLPI